MFIEEKIELIGLDFNEGIKVFVDGPEDYYFIEVKEYFDTSDVPKNIESYVISSKDFFFKKNFELSVEYYMDFEVVVNKVIDGFGIVPIFRHRYNDYDMPVLFKLDTDDKEECELWVNLIEKYRKLHGCRVYLDTIFVDIKNKVEKFPKPKGDFYKTYRIGRYPKTSTDFRTLDERKENFIWFNFWKIFWSYQHPKEWGGLDSKSIAEDILGLTK